MKDGLDGLVEQMLRGSIFLEEAVEVLERSMIEGALARSNGNQSAASKMLGIHRNTLQRKMQTFGLEGSRTHRKPVHREARTRRRQVGAA
jgi:DNA-binding NtrC family response regulator